MNELHVFIKLNKLEAKKKRQWGFPFYMKHALFINDNGVGQLSFVFSDRKDLPSIHSTLSLVAW